MSEQSTTPQHNAPGPQTLFGAGIAIIFSVIAFIISLYDIFTQTNILFNSTIAWSLASCSLACLVLSAAMFAVISCWLPILTLLIGVAIAVIAIIATSWWLVLCSCLIILGCTIQFITQRN